MKMLMFGQNSSRPHPKSPAFPFIDNSLAEKHQNVNQGRLCNGLISYVARMNR
jgi:hypothetical protein